MLCIGKGEVEPLDIVKSATSGGALSSRGSFSRLNHRSHYQKTWILGSKLKDGLTARVDETGASGHDDVCLRRSGSPQAPSAGRTRQDADAWKGGARRSTERLGEEVGFEGQQSPCTFHMFLFDGFSPEQGRSESDWLGG